MSRCKLMIPGPVDVPEDVRQAMSVASMPHYGPEWLQLYGETQEMLRQVLKTRAELCVVSGPGTLSMEIGLASTLDRGDAVIIPTNGFFGERLVAVAESHDLLPIAVRVEPGLPILAEDVTSSLRAHPEAKAVALVHHETSTGVLNPLESISAAVREHGKLLMVDAVSSFGGVPLPVDDWGIDICVSVANKALETPPALSFLSVSDRAWQAVERRSTRCGWYTDLKTWRWYARNWGDWHPTPVTMPTSNLYALHHSLQSLLEAGIESRYAAYVAAARATRQGLNALDLPMFVENACASPLTTAFCVGDGLDADDMKRWLEVHAQIMVSGGIGELHGRILRVGHIGLARKRDYVVALLLAVEDYLRAVGRSIPAGRSLVALDGLEI